MATLVERPVAGAPPGRGGAGTAAETPAVNPWIVAVSVMLATFMEVLDTTIASVALPYIAGSMAASNSEATWVLTTYLIANAVVLPASNWFGLRFGRKRFLLVCVGLFIASSFLCGSAPSLAFLLIARVFQGAGGGAAGPFDNVGFGLLCLWTGSLQIILDKGQEVDWFGAVWVRWAAVLLVVSFTWFVVHSWRARAPLVDLRVIVDNWNFRICCILIFLLGFILYIQVSVLPLFYQEILGYTALTAGIVVAPRGLGAMMGLPLVGFASQKLDNRWLLFVGFLVFALSSLIFGLVDLEIGPTTLLLAIIVAGFGMSFLFVPIGNLGTATIPNPEMGNATGIFNLLRNIGGSVGIALAQTELTRRANFHQARLAAATPQTNFWLQQDAVRLSRYLGMHLGAAAGQASALGALYRQMLQQAALLSFIDIFRWSALVALAAAGIGWLFRRMTAEADGSVRLH